MNASKTQLAGVLIIQPDVFRDDRGFFLESFQAERYSQILGPGVTFVQDNHSRSHRGVLRGLHLQKENPQGKLVRVARGKVWDVAVDINPKSNTFKSWVGVELSDQNARQLWIPPGYAHGFVVLSEIADFEYKCTAYYDPHDEIGIHWNDPDLRIQWPLQNPTVSPKDASNRTVSDLMR